MRSRTARAALFGYGMMLACGSPPPSEPPARAAVVRDSAPVRRPLTEDVVVAGIDLSAEPDTGAVRAALGAPQARPHYLNGKFYFLEWGFRDVAIEFGADGLAWGVLLTGPAIATSRGLRVGDSEERVTDLYGEPDERNDSTLVYQFGVEPRRAGSPINAGRIEVHVFDGRVRSIRLRVEFFED